MNKLFAILAAIATIFFQLFRSERRKRQEAEAETEALQRKDATEDAIQQATSDTVERLMQEQKPAKGKDITLFCIAMLMMLTGCAAPKCYCPELSLLPRPAYEPVTLRYTAEDLYCTDYEGASSLLNEMQHRNTLIDGYEGQIRIYQNEVKPSSGESLR